MNFFIDPSLYSDIDSSFSESSNLDWRTWALFFLLVALINWIGMALSWKFNTPIFQLIGYAIMIIFWGSLVYVAFEDIFSFLCNIFHSLF